MLMLLRRKSLRIAEAPTVMSERRSGGSRIFSSWFTVARYMIATTVLSVARDELLCPPPIAGALIRRVGLLAAESRETRLGARLTRREREVLALLTRGLSNREIAHLLSIAVATTKNHVHNILDKLEVGSRAEASAWAGDV